jgi:G3E family GTPase
MGGAGAAFITAAAATPPRIRERAAPAYVPVHDDAVVAHALRLAEPMDADVLAEWLDALVAHHGERLLRVKGLVDIEGEERPLVVHAVQHLVAPPRFLPAWPPGRPGTRLVFITRGLEAGDLMLGYAGREPPRWS